MNGFKKRWIALSLAVCTLLSMSATAAYAATGWVGWYGPLGEEGFVPVTDTVTLTWGADFAEAVDLSDGDLSDWDDTDIPTIEINANNLVAWSGEIPADRKITLRVASDADNLYVAARIVDSDVIKNTTVQNPADLSNLTNYNTGDNLQLALDFGRKIAYTVENDRETASFMNSDKAIFYSVGFRGDNQDVYVSVEESDDSRVLSPYSGVTGKTFLTDDGWATEFCIPLDELFWDVCYKTFHESYNDMIRESMIIDESHPLEIGMSVYQMDWSTVSGTKEMSGAFGLHNGTTKDSHGNPLMTWSSTDVPAVLSMPYESGMTFSSPFLLTPGKEPLEIEPDLDVGYGHGNVAAHARVSVNNGNSFESYEVDGWGLAALTDLDTSNGWHSNISGFSGSTWDAPTILTIHLGATYEIDRVNLYPYTGDDYSDTMVPRNYSIEVFSPESNRWVVVARDTDVLAANGAYTVPCLRVERLSYSFTPIMASRVRLVIFEDSLIDIGGTCSATCIGEIEVLAAGDGTDIDFVPGDEPELEKKNGLSNLAVGKRTSINNQNSYEDDSIGWGLYYLTDGSIYSAWVNDPDAGAISSSPTILTINLGKTYEIRSIELYPYAVEFGDSTVPRAFSLEAYSTKQRAWVEVATEWSAYVEPGLEDEECLAYSFAPILANRVRVRLLKDSSYYAASLAGVTAIGEIAVWGSLPNTSNGNNAEETNAPEAESGSETLSSSAAESETARAPQESTDKDKDGLTAVRVVSCAASTGLGAATLLLISAAAVMLYKRKA